MVVVMRAWKKTAVVRGHCCWVVASSSFLRTNKHYYYWFVQQAFFVRPKHLMLTCHMLIFECSWRTLLWSCWIFERFERKNQHKHYFRFVKPDKTWMCHMLFFPMVWRIMIYQSLDLHIVDATGVWTVWWKLSFLFRSIWSCHGFFYTTVCTNTQWCKQTIIPNSNATRETFNSEMDLRYTTAWRFRFSIVSLICQSLKLLFQIMLNVLTKSSTETATQTLPFTEKLVSHIPTIKTPSKAQHVLNCRWNRVSALTATSS